MGNYTKIVDYAAKDLLLTGDPAKAGKGTEIGAEFDAIAAMSATKADLTQLAASSGASLVGFIQVGTGAVATTAQVELRNFVTPEQFGAVGNYTGAGAGTDDSSAFRLAVAHLVSLGAGTLLLGVGKRYRVFSDGVTTTLAAFASMRSITIDFNGAELIVDRTFTGSQEVTLFEFTTCNNISFKSPVVSCSQTQPAGQKTSRGPRFATFLNGCKGVSNDVAKITSFRFGWDIRRGAADAASFISSGFDLGVTFATTTGYPLFGTLSGYGVKATLVTDTCGRSYFVSGGRDHEVNVISKNHEASVDCLLVTDSGDGMHGVKLTYTNTESATADNTINCVRVEFQSSDVNIGTHRDIHVHLNIKTTSTAWLGYGFAVGKVKADDTADAVDRGHFLENIKVTGQINGGSANQRSLGICNVGTWGAGENVRNISLRDLWMSVVGQSTINLASLKNTAVLDNVYSSAQMNITGNSVGRIICTGVTCNGSLTETTADTSLVDYIGCKIDSLTNQSIINKRFINMTTVPADAIVHQPTALVIAPQIVANQNDYSPTGLSTASLLVISSDAARDITGILAAVQNGKQLTINNAGNFNITLKNANAGSAAANRFQLKGAVDAVLAAQSGIVLVYFSGRWQDTRV